MLFAAAFIMNGSEDLLQLLPPSGTPEGWQRSEDQLLIEGRGLYGHINGGAELFFQHGFQALALADYSDGEYEIRVEIYDMGTAEGAAGIFAANTAGLEITSDFGEASSIDDLQIIFRKGQYYVTITCYEIEPELNKAMTTLSKKVEEAIS